MKEIRVRFGGGLGNQLYQYAFLLYLKHLKIDVIPDFSEFTYYAFHHGLELNKVIYMGYGLEINHVEKSRKRWYKIFNEKLGFWLRFRYLQFVNKYFDHVVLEDPNKFYELKDIPKQNRLILKGHWQKLGYVEAVREKLTHYVNLELLTDDRDKMIVNQIRNSDSVSIHVRRGDYLKENQYQVIKNFGFYEKAIAEIKKYSPDVTFYVFSDDIAWVKSQMKEKNVVYIDWNTGANSFKDMLLMSLCKHNIIANSTFSWWGAYLNTHPDKKVVCPNYWMVGEKTGDRVPQDWIQLEV